MLIAKACEINNQHKFEHKLKDEYQNAQTPKEL